jgi:hypothetical protein
VTKKTKKLVATLVKRDQVAGFLSNLEKLGADGSVSEGHYALIRREYEQRVEAASSEIERLKGELKRQLEIARRDIQVYEWELGKVELRYKAGELTLEKYRNSERKLRGARDKLEEQCEEYARLIAAGSSADCGEVAVEAVTVAGVSARLSRISASLSEIRLPRVKLPRAKRPQLPSLSERAAAQGGMLKPRSRLVGLIAGGLLIISLLLPWLAPTEALGSGLSSIPGRYISPVILVGGIACGVIVMVASLFLGSGVRGAVHIAMGLTAPGILLALIVTGLLPLTDYVLTLVVVREGLYLYVAASLMLIVTGLVERRQR